MSQPDVDVVVIGAGIVGLASAAALASAGRSVYIVETHDGIARECTSRNSEVIHAGIYYPKESLKAKLCREGRDALYRRCAERGIPHKRLGKLIVATCEEEIVVLERLLETATANEVPGLRMLEPHEIREPHLRVCAALLSPETGIVDAHALALSFQAQAEEGGGVLLLQHRVVGIEYAGGVWKSAVRPAGAEKSEYVTSRFVVNAAGLASDAIAAMAGIDIDARGYRQHPCKGDYFALAPGAPIRFERLVYPVPAGAGLGVHATLDLGGRIRFGPDAEYVSEVRYEVDPAKRTQFAEAVRRYVPALEDAWLTPDYAGIRTKLAGPGEGFRDFVISEESELGLPGLVNCIGIESPGLTSSTAIGLRVAALLDAL